MTLELRDCSFSGPALPEPFVKFELETHLANAKLLRKTTGPEGKALAAEWEVLRRKLRSLGDIGGSTRVTNHVIAPLMERLGYTTSRRENEVQTREATEDGGTVYSTADGKSYLRAWALDVGADFDAPSKRGHAYRFSPTRVAQRVLLAKGERLGLLTDGTELRLLLCDPARPESHIAIRLDRAGGWRGPGEVRDSYRLVLALACPEGLPKLPELVEQARLTQTRVTTKLREQAKLAVTGFVQELLDDPANAAALREHTDRQTLARTLWSESLVVIYRLLFILKLESSPDPARAFSFASTSLWRRTYSPNTALAGVLDAFHKGEETGRMLGDGLRVLFRLFRDGLRSSELKVSPLGGMLFGENATPLLERLVWSERAAARLLDNLLWTPKSGKIERQRVHYGALDVEDLGRVYEALLELEPGIATEPMCRLRRQKLEVVVPLAQGAPYRTSAPVAEAEDGSDEADDEEADDEEDKPARGKATKVQWIEEIKPGSYYLRVGLGRKATGSYYTPHAFVRFLIQETLGPQVAERSPEKDPQPLAILKLKVLDPAMGSGHFLVEACRFLGDKLYEACRLCDELAMAAESQGDAARAAELRQRVSDLPDPNDELLAYLPSRVLEGSESGLSQAKAIALCRRLVAVHSLYGVDKNPLAVELAKLSLWLESYAEGLPLTFLDHRLIHGDSLTGPFFEKLGTYPKSGAEVRDLFTQKLTERLKETLAEALVHVRDLEATIGKDVADIELKRAVKKKLDESLAPFEVLAATWSGGVMLGEQARDDDYAALMDVVAAKGDVRAMVASRPTLGRLVEVGKEGVAYDLVFPEVFYPEGMVGQRRGFDAVVGNPPWDAVRRSDDQFLAGFEFSVLELRTKAEKKSMFARLTARPEIGALYKTYTAGLEAKDRVMEALFEVHRARVNDNLAGRGIYDDYMLFAERAACVLSPRVGRVGLVLPSAFHANEGAVGLRRLYLDQMRLACCFSFENRRKVFEIDSRFKFALVVAARDTAGTASFDCAFYLHEVDWLFRDHEVLAYPRDLVKKLGGVHLTFPELRSPKDLDVAQRCYAGTIRLGDERVQRGVVTSQELNMTYDSHRFTASSSSLGPAQDSRDPQVACMLLEKGLVSLHEGKTFHQYTDKWAERPRFLVALQQVIDKPSWLQAAQYCRLAFRDIASATNERTCIFCLAPAGVLFGNTAPCEREPWSRPNHVALNWLGILNSHAFDWNVRQKATTHVNLFVLDACPLPPSAFTRPRSLFLAHSALRLTCNHEGYAALWLEQLGPNTWREPAPKHTWPVLAGDDARWKVRAAIDAVVADAYGLSRDQYAHVLSSFSHKSYPKAPALCLAAFDELKENGLDAFTREHDPYWDVPLNESLPKPVIELPIPGQAAGAGAVKEAAVEGAEFRLTPSEPKKPGRKKRA